MRLKSYSSAALAWLFATAVGAVTAAEPTAAERAAALLEHFTAAQSEAGHRPLNDVARTDWTYLPFGHSGVPRDQLTTAQQRQLGALLATVLSDSGLEAAASVTLLEQVLQDASTWFKWFRNPGAYHIAVFGEPSRSPFWSWRYGGHHLSVNATYAPGQTFATPLFIGASPAKVATGEHAGMRLLGAEEDAARSLYLSLAEAAKAAALIDTKAPRDILSGRDPLVRLACCEGLPYSDMTTAQRAGIKALVRQVLGRLRPEIAGQLHRNIEAANANTLHFSWAGSERPGEGHYFRIHGPSLLIEYDNTQNAANHAHLVLRDPQRDFGGDTLMAHLTEHPH